ncbi:MAG: gamma-glutamylcyclotransferase family protein [Erysipelotrichaceae bacterium]|nr:gamma-glutamylcyclotransferase family protein [Erysipelotrichaceae bacterium]
MKRTVKEMYRELDTFVKADMKRVNELKDKYLKEDGSYWLATREEMYGGGNDVYMDMVVIPTYETAIKMLREKKYIDHKTIKWSLNNRFAGHSYSSLDTQLYYLDKLLDCDLRELDEEEREMLVKIIEGIRKLYASNSLFSFNVEEDRTHIKDVLKKYDRDVYTFTYGSLMKGEYNHPIIEDCECIGKAECMGYRLYTNNYYPYMTKSLDESNVVYGELYILDEGAKHYVRRIESAEYDELQVTVQANNLTYFPAAYIAKEEIDLNRYMKYPVNMSWTGRK